ncbi:hypothetical protein SPRG_00777 [Saprolegnia parasitica CBS 223.65]|uniref:Uncharacterized protein n=1 Tax=Saprolegnia parasitica (strain CBS 223.65) TaxID=695850 RepID=A0A067CZP7_SAPPC|nr:hypothetical protein SPRG_00777 [Saprolegnia parasitica CBS 223.65]KDO34715.1 hypothetical protein SPRG_00777 [Saprolegnia parasitica CBS 223.65]|eukprot:XP_012194384.1 hypothetical protein SPRG_00777 [Saprolegnia parasitica CBS 223.65]
MTGDSVGVGAPPEPVVITIDDFDQDASSDGELLNSPRSLEACCEVGVTPAELLRRPLSYFERPHESASLTQKRAERYERHREQLFDQVRAVRQALLQTKKPQPSSPGKSTIVASHSLSPSKKARTYVSLPTEHTTTTQGGIFESTMLETERRRLEKIQQRQLMEMQQLMHMELKRAEMDAAMQQAAEQRKMREDAIERDKARRAKDADDARRRREAEKAAQEAEAILQQKRLAQKDYEDTQRRKAADILEAKARKADAARRERERQRKQDEHHEMTQEILTELQQQAMARMHEMNVREQLRREKLEKARDDRARQVHEKAMRNKARIEHVLTDKERLAEEQRTALERRQAESERRRQQHEHELQLRKQEQAELEEARRVRRMQKIRDNQRLAEEERRRKLLEAETEAEYRLRKREEAKERERKEKQKEDERRQEERARVAARMREVEEVRATTVLHKTVEKGRRTETVQEKRRAELRNKLEDAKLREEEIAHALERQARKDDYHRSLLQAKLQADHERAEALRRQKDMLLKQRQVAQQKANVQRHEILDSFHRMKVTKKFDLSKLASKNGIDLSVHRTQRVQATTAKDDIAKSLDGRPPSGRIPARPKRPATAKTRKPPPATASSACRERYISRRISRYPRHEAAASSSSPAVTSVPLEVSNEDAVRDQLDQFRRRQNQELLHVLEEEQAAEEQREIILRNAGDVSERRRLEKIFGVERNMASERIMRLTEEHEIMFTQRMADLDVHCASPPK